MLYSPLKLRNLELKNRWVMSPMCMYSCENGMPNDFHFVHYGSRAQGGVGLIIIEATGVVPEGRITNKCMGIWNDDQADALSKIVKFVHENSASKIGIQFSYNCFTFLVSTLFLNKNLASYLHTQCSHGRSLVFWAMSRDSKAAAMGLFVNCLKRQI